MAALVSLLVLAILVGSLILVGTFKGHHLGVVSDDTGVDQFGDLYSIQSIMLNDNRHSAATDSVSSSTDNLLLLDALYWQTMRKMGMGLLRVEEVNDDVCVYLRGTRLLLFKFSGRSIQEVDGVKRLARRVSGGFFLATGSDAVNGELAIELASDKISLVVSGYRSKIARIFGMFVYRMTQSRFHILLAVRYLRETKSRLQES